MQEDFKLNVLSRDVKGKGASRRLRREGLVPGIIYGAGKDPEMFVVKHNELVQHLDHEAFYSHILSVNVGDKTEQVVLKDLQRHPSKPFVTHVDLMRVKMNEEIRMTVPLHFDGEDVCVGVKAGGILLKGMTDLDIECLPGDLPESISVDVSGLNIGDVIHFSELVVPQGVTILGMDQVDEENDPVVVSIDVQRAELEEGEDGEAPAAYDAGAAGAAGQEGED